MYKLRNRRSIVFFLIMPEYLMLHVFLGTKIRRYCQTNAQLVWKMDFRAHTEKRVPTWMFSSNGISFVCRKKRSAVYLNSSKKIRVKITMKKSVIFVVWLVSCVDSNRDDISLIRPNLPLVCTGMLFNPRSFSLQFLSLNVKD